MVHLAVEFLALNPRDIRQDEPEAAFRIGPERNRGGDWYAPYFLAQAARIISPRGVLDLLPAARFAAALGRADTNFACCVPCGDSYCRCT